MRRTAPEPDAKPKRARQLDLFGMEAELDEARILARRRRQRLARERRARPSWSLPESEGTEKTTTEGATESGGAWRKRGLPNMEALPLQDVRWPTKGATKALRRAFVGAIEGTIMRIAYERQERGFTAADVRLRAMREGLPAPDEHNQRAWSFLSGVFRGLVKKGYLSRSAYNRASRIERSHGNKHVVYIYRKPPHTTSAEVPYSLD